LTDYFVSNRPEATTL